MATKDKADTKEGKKCPIVDASNKSEIGAFLLDKSTLNKFINVKLTNNQKGRIRQNVLRDLTSFEENGRHNSKLIFAKIQAIMKSNSDLSEPEQKKLKILHNFLTAAVKESVIPANVVNIQEESPDTIDVKQKIKKEKKEKPKRYILFVGNLPKNVTPEEVKQHFKEILGIVSVRIQKEEMEEKQEVNNKKKKQNLSRTFAHLELADEFSYKLALSKHHTMLGNRRINILYSRNKDKIDKKTLKKKSSKVHFLSKSATLSANKKRSIRRKKQLQANQENT